MNGTIGILTAAEAKGIVEGRVADESHDREFPQ